MSGEPTSDVHTAASIMRTAPSFLGHLLGMNTLYKLILSWLGISLLLDPSTVWQVVKCIERANRSGLWLALANGLLLPCQLAAAPEHYAALFLHRCWTASLDYSEPSEGPGDHPTGGHDRSSDGAGGSGRRLLQSTNKNAGSNSNRTSDNGRGRREGQIVLSPAGDPETHEEKQNGRFQCTWHHVQGYVHDQYCAKTVKYVSMLRRHHQKHGFFYCLVCHLVFDTLQARDDHGTCAHFKCVTRGCPNRGRYAARTQFLCNHIRDQNDQDDMYIELCRLAKRKFGLQFKPNAFEFSYPIDLGNNQDEESGTPDEDSTSVDDPPVSGRGTQNAAPRPRSVSASILPHMQNSQLPATASQLAARVTSMGKLLRRLEDRGTSMTDTETYAIQAVITAIDQCHTQLLKRWKQTTSRRSEDTLAEISVLMQTESSGAEASYASQSGRKRPRSSTSGYLSPLNIHIHEPRSPGDLLPEIGTRFPGNIRHPPLPETSLMQAGVPHAQALPVVLDGANDLVIKPDWLQDLLTYQIQDGHA